MTVHRHRARSIEFFLAGRTLANPQVSPDGTRAAFVTSSPTRTELALVALGENAPEMWLPLDPGIASCRSSNGNVYAWLPNGDAILYFSVYNTLCMFDFTTASVETLLETGENPESLALSHDGTHCAWTSDMSRIHAVALPFAHEDDRVVHGSTGADFVLDPSWSPDASTLVWQEWDDPSMPWRASRIAALDIATGTKCIVDGGDFSVQQPRFSPDGRSLAYLSDREGWLNLWIVDAHDLASPRMLFGERCEHGDPQWGGGFKTFAWSNDSQHIFLRRNIDGNGQLVKVEVSSGIVFPVARGWFSSLSAHNNGVIAIRADANRVGDVTLIDASHSTRVLGESTPTDLGLANALYEPTHITWQSADGLMIPGRLYGVDEKPKPMIVWIHGGPTDQSRVTPLARLYYFLERGWMVFVPDYRGSSGCGRAFQQALDGKWGIADVDDVLSGIAYACEQGWADRTRTVAIGASAGGLTLLSMLARDDNPCAAGIALYPVCDLLTLAATTWRFEQHYMDTLIGPLPAFADTYQARSPSTFAERIRVPLLLLHGERDEVIPVEHSINLAERIRESGGDVEFHIYDNEKHGWRQQATRVDELTRIVAFLDKTAERSDKEESQ